MAQTIFSDHTYKLRMFNSSNHMLIASYKDNKQTNMFFVKEHDDDYEALEYAYHVMRTWTGQHLSEVLQQWRKHSILITPWS